MIQIKLYDTRSQRRPIQSYQANATYKDRAIQRLLPSPAAEHVLYFSDNVGGVADFDLRKGNTVYFRNIGWNLYRKNG